MKWLSNIRKELFTMSSDAKANTLPKWSYILLAVLLVPFGVGLIWAIVSKGNVPDAVTVIAAVCIFTAIALIVHLAWPRRSMWFAHLAAFVLFSYCSSPSEYWQKSSPAWRP